MAWISDCYHDSKALFPLRIALFSFYGAIFSLVPFLSSHMRALGLSVDETLTVHAIVLLAAFVAAPAAGYLSDVIGHVRRVLVVLILLTGVFHSSLLAMPSEVNEHWPFQAQLLCTDSGGYLFVGACPYPQTYCPIGEEANWTMTSILKCRQQCISHSKDPNVTEPPPPDPTICFPGRYREDCEPFAPKLLTPANFSLVAVPTMYESRSECVHRIKSVLWNDQERIYPRCPSKKGKCSMNCTLSFTAINGSRVLCDQPPSIPSFPAYFILRLLCAGALVAAVALFETAIVRAASHHKVPYGRQKVWAYVAAAIFTPAAGTLVDQSQLQTDAKAFYPLIIIFDVLLLVCLGVMCFAGLSMQPARLRIKAHPQPVTQILQRFEAVLLLGAVFFIGAFWGVLSTFLLGFLEVLGSTNSLLGIAKMVGSLMCIPTIYFADYIIKSIGHINILSAAFLFYGLQLLCYSFLSHPWWSLAIEFLNFISDALKVAAMVTLAHKVAPTGRGATTQGTVHCLHYNVGAGLGILISGALADMWHLRISFRSLGICSLVIGVVYAAVYHLMKTKKPYKAGATNGRNPDGKEEMMYMPETGV